MSVMQELLWLLPEIVLVVGACVILLMPRSWAWPLTVLVLVAAMAILWGMAPESPVLLMGGAFERAAELDPLRILICALTLLALFYARSYPVAMDRLRSTEFYVLAIFGCVGMLLISGGKHLIVLYMGLEILALSLYPMVAMARDDGRAGEAAMKYFVLGALASGFLLYGMSLLYVATGTLHVDALAAQLAGTEIDRVQLLGMLLMLAGLAFKMGAAPFHMWLPDVYDGAPLPVATYLSAAPKIAGVLLLLRLFGEGLSALSTDWSVLMAALALISLAVGNLLAIAQTRIRRMLAYSAIAHAGFIFLALCAASPRGMAAAAFYTAIYAVMAVGVFGMLHLINVRESREEIADFKGLHHTHPGLALMMLIMMFSMAGVPLTAGFYAKLYVLQAVVDAGLWVLAAVAVVLTVVGAYYYLRIVWYMYFEKVERPVESDASWMRTILVSANALLLVLIFAMPQAWLEWAQAAVTRFSS